MLQPYIESATALSDYDEEIARISHFCRSAEMDFQHLAGPRNVSVMMFRACECVCVWYTCLSQEK